MTHAVENMAYAASGGVPWHGLGFPVDDKMTALEMAKAAKIDWTVSKRSMFFKADDGKVIEVEADKALVRDTDNRLLSIVGKDWNEVQNNDIAEWLQKFIKAGNMKIETAGSLWNGRYIWFLARVNKDFAIGKGSKADEVRSYMLIMVPHVHGKAGVIQYTPVRVVCWNTLNFALGAGLKGDGKGFRMPHTRAFNDDTKARAEEAMGLAQKQAEEFQVAASLLAKKKAKRDEVELYFNEVVNFNPREVKKDADGKEKMQREPLLIPKFRYALEHSPGATLPSAEGTWWGAVNAVTHVIDHEIGRDRNTALRNAWIGNHSNTKLRAVELALAKAA